MRIVLAVLLVALVASSVPARAADSCMTFAQARAAFPNKHLWWSRAQDASRCWHSNAPARSTRHRLTTSTREPVPAPRFSVLWPVLAGAGPPESAALYYPAQMTHWPLVLDVDALTAPGTVDASGNPATDFCCWPALAFSERWFALPSNWFLAAIGEHLK